MLGNDIVDLKKAALESNWKRKGYLEKVFTAKEQLAILNSSNPNLTVWLFWSMKEAVYKIVNRATLNRFDSPQKFECYITLTETCQAVGHVIYNGITYFTKSEINPNFVYSLATGKISNLKKIWTDHLKNTIHYSQLSHKEFKFIIQKNLFGIPELKDCKSNTTKPISITHHGKYLAIAY